MGTVVQRLMNICDNVEDGGGLIIIPGFHNQFDKWLNSLGSEMTSSDMGSYKFDAYPRAMALAQRVTMRAGSVVVWDQRCTHGSKMGRRTTRAIAFVSPNFSRRRRRAPCQRTNSSSDPERYKSWYMIMILPSRYHPSGRLFSAWIIHNSGKGNIARPFLPEKWTITKWFCESSGKWVWEDDTWYKILPRRIHFEPLLGRHSNFLNGIDVSSVQISARACYDIAIEFSIGTMDQLIADRDERLKNKLRIKNVI